MLHIVKGDFWTIVVLLVPVFFFFKPKQIILLTLTKCVVVPKPNRNIGTLLSQHEIVKPDEHCLQLFWSSVVVSDGEQQHYTC